MLRRRSEHCKTTQYGRGPARHPERDSRWAVGAPSNSSITADAASVCSRCQRSLRCVTLVNWLGGLHGDDHLRSGAARIIDSEDADQNISVLKNRLPGIGLFSIKAESARERLFWRARPRKHPLTALVASSLDFAISDHDDFYLIARLAHECPHYRIWQSNREAISPLGISHK